MQEPAIVRDKLEKATSSIVESTENIFAEFVTRTIFGQARPIFIQNRSGRTVFPHVTGPAPLNQGLLPTIYITGLKAFKSSSYTPLYYVKVKVLSLDLGIT